MSGKILRMSGRAPAFAPHELEQQRDDFLNGVEVVELFNNDVPRVRNELVIKPRGMPPESWDLIPIASLK